MDDRTEPPQFRPILANLGREICRPLDTLRLDIAQFLDDGLPIPEAEKAQARTMLTICEELGRLTRERLGEAGGPAPAGGD